MFSQIRYQTETVVTFSPLTFNLKNNIHSIEQSTSCGVALIRHKIDAASWLRGRRPAVLLLPLVAIKRRLEMSLPGGGRIGGGGAKAP